MTKCPKCKFYNICKGRINETVENCVRFKSTEQTNEEWLRQAATEQLAEFIVGVARDGGDALKRCNGSFEPLNIYKHEFWVEWLKQPHTTKE